MQLLAIRFIIFVLSVAAIGCHDSLGTLSGEVTFEGSPVDTGAITLSPADGRGSITGGEIRDGSYSVSGIAPGRKLVTIHAVKMVPFARSSEDMAKRAAEQKRLGNDNGLIDPADIIPPDAVGNNIEIEIESGAQTRDFDLTKAVPR